MKTLKKDLLVLSVTLIFLVMGGVLGVATSSDAQTKAAPIKLKAAFFTPPSGFWFASIEHFLKDVEARTKGRLVFERYWAQSLVGAKEIPDALAGGIADLGTIIPG